MDSFSGCVYKGCESASTAVITNLDGSVSEAQPFALSIAVEVAFLPLATSPVVHLAQVLVWPVGAMKAPQC